MLTRYERLELSGETRSENTAKETVENWLASFPDDIWEKKFDWWFNDDWEEWFYDASVERIVPDAQDME